MFTLLTLHFHSTATNDEKPLVYFDKHDDYTMYMREWDDYGDDFKAFQLCCCVGGRYIIPFYTYVFLELLPIYIDFWFF